jgi:pSer/pThr/pTyr-binding forkhead associated (FHA) protein
VRIGRGPAPKYNDLALSAKRISNSHCLIYRLDDTSLDPEAIERSNNGNGISNPNEPIVIIQDLKSSNGTFINSHRITRRHVLKHGDEVSLGANGPLPNMEHDVRWIFKSVGKQGVGDEGRVGEIFERFHFQET